MAVNMAIDLTTVRDVAGDDDAFVRSVLGAFRRNANRLRGQLAAAAACGETATLKQVAHGLKGSLRTLGAFDAAAAALSIEEFEDDGGVEVDGQRGGVAYQALTERFAEELDALLAEVDALLDGRSA